ncbi:MAG: hypothetical protein R3E88_16910 [Myxococcota bacterium]
MSQAPAAPDVPDVALAAAPASPAAAWRAIQAAFLVSGACGLAYEVLWGRWLASVLGSSATAACVVLAAYMGGQAIGAAAFGALSLRLRRPLVTYVAVEIAIGAAALAFPHVADRALGLAPSLRVASAVALLLVPTVLLGGTVPLVLRWSEVASLPAGATLARLYGLNTVGAAVGAVATGFALVPSLGLAASNALAACGNFAVAAAVGWLAARTAASTAAAGVRAPELEPPAAARAAPAPPGAVAPASASARPAPAFLLHALAFASGFVAFGLEIVFLRLLRITLSSTTYTFTLVIATFVAGIGVGGLLAARRPERAPVAADLARLQLALVALLLVDFGLAPWTQQLGAAFGGGFLATQLEAAVLCAVLLLPVTLVMGAAFPLLGRLFMARGGRGARVGALYAANTLGAVSGAVATTVLAIPALGTSRTYLALVALAAASMVVYVGLASPGLDDRVRAGSRAALAALAAVALLAPAWPPVYLGVSAGYLRGDARAEIAREVEYFAEGASSTVLVHRLPIGSVMRIDGKPVASSAPGDLANQLLLGHLPALLAGAPRSGLVVGMGTGMTLGALAQHGLERLDVVELERRVPDGARLFAEHNGSVLDRPELRVVFDDGFNFLHAESHRYDVVTSDPIHPFVRGGATLYSADYFARASARLSERGVFAHWLPLANMGEGDFAMIVRSFTDVFPYARLYWNGSEDGVLVGRNVPWNEPEIAPGEFARVARSLERMYVESLDAFAALRAADRAQLVAWAGDGPRSTLDRPLLEFSAPRAMHEWTLDRNLRTLARWRGEAREPGAPWHALGLALRLLGVVAPSGDLAALRGLWAEATGCAAGDARCAPRPGSELLRRALFEQTFRAGAREARAAAAGAPDVARARAADVLLAMAQRIASPARAEEALVVERERARLRAAAPGVVSPP